ncbi:MAG: 6-phosphofructokinase [Clostridia bacterium]|nr:6-phosphofructokinase [Clostridia bacterium]MBQ6937599.1 6-phosphofructokinase [Clostridia bacterium]
MAEIKKVAIMTGGGDCPSLNAVIRAVTTTAIVKYGLEVVGIRRGYHGLYHKDFISLTLDNVQEIIGEGGSILKSSNKDNLFKYPVRDENGDIVKKDGKIVYENVSHVGVQNLKDEGIDALFILGGDGTLTSGRDFARLGVNVIGIPKTIDNDLACTDYTYGFDTAIGIVSNSLDRLRTTAKSHGRIMVAEVMGRGAGWLTLHGGIAGAADAILIPEIPYDINKVAEKIKADFAKGKDFAIVAVAEGAKPKDGEAVVLKVREDSPDPIRLGGIANVVADQLEELCGNEARATILGHVQRGGSTSGHDRVLSSRYGYAAVELAMQGKFGNMVIIKGDKMTYASLEEVIGQETKQVDPDGELIKMAKALGISFGD